MGIFNPDGSLNKSDQPSGGGSIDWNAVYKQSKAAQASRYTAKQRSDKGFDFYNGSQKTTIEEFSKAKGFQPSDVRAYLASQGDTQAQQILAKQMAENNSTVQAFNKMDVYQQRTRLKELQDLASRTTFKSAEDIKNRDWAREQLAQLQIAGQQKGGNPITLAQDIVGGTVGTYGRFNQANALAIDAATTNSQSNIVKQKLDAIASASKIRGQLLEKYAAKGPQTGSPVDRMSAQDKKLYNSLDSYIKLRQAEIGATSDKNLEATDPTKYAGAAASVVLDAVTAGMGGKIVGSTLNASGRGIAAKTANTVFSPTGVIQGAASGVGLGAAYGAAGTAEQLGSQATPTDYLTGAATGGVVGGVLGATVGVFSGKASSRLKALKQAEATRATMPELPQSIIDSVTPNKIAVSGESAATGVDVRTPTKVGIKQETTTNNVEVRTKMSDKEYTNRFNQISKSYDTAMKKLEANSSKMTDAVKKTVASAIDEQHLAKLNQLDSEYLNPIASKSTSKVTQVGKPSVSRTPTTGGLQKTFVNTAESANPTLRDTTTFAQATPPKTEFTTTRTSKTKDTTAKTSGSSIILEQQAIEANLGKIDELANYGAGSIKEESAKVVDELATNPERVKEIALGNIRGDNPIHEEAAYAAVRNKAMQEGDVATIAQLAKSRLQTKLSESAQRLQARGYGYETHDPVELIRELRDARVKTISKRAGKSEEQLISSTKQQIQKAIKKPTKNEWADFVSSLECK